MSLRAIYIVALLVGLPTVAGILLTGAVAESAAIKCAEKGYFMKDGKCPAPEARGS
ncbi:hypothetical protein [Chromobacterium violaceum]|uniref:hypothetical protein n=1 Tax=Chromobacterium violaceum TaxID=536 RepID=UPI00194E2F70|nr:hypothetical protein [Chromobacterium violaceum]QRO33979.1 hypothetical protein I6K04_04340 [Chromobacterium violaceum]QRQ16218.1 hypothetical protein I6K03_18390 [Chromobacterium violaceum]